MCRICLLSLGALLWAVAGCATGDSSMTDINWDPGLQSTTVEGGPGEASPPSSAARDSGGAQPPQPDASDGVPDPPDSSRPEASSSVDGSSTDGSSPVSEAGGVDAPAVDAGAAEAGIPEAGGSDDSPSTTQACPSTAQYAAEAAAATFSGSATFCPSGTCPSSSQCCYEQLKPVNVCVAR